MIGPSRDLGRFKNADGKPWHGNTGAPETPKGLGLSSAKPKPWEPRQKAKLLGETEL